VGPKVTATATTIGSNNTSEFSAPSACPDSDGDFLCNSGDSCAANPDCDADGWKDGSEANYIGTDPLDGCANTPAANDEADDRWPADMNDNQFSDISDIVLLTGNFGAAVPPAPARYNVGPEPADGFIDITDISRLTGRFGQGCAP
jgi:hypothetical protein